MSKTQETLDKIKSLVKLNYCLIFDKCFHCNKDKGPRFLFCSIACALKCVRN